MRFIDVRLPDASSAVIDTRTITRAWRFLSCLLISLRVRAEMRSLIFVRTPGLRVMRVDEVRSVFAICSAAIRPDAVTLQSSSHLAYT